MAVEPAKLRILREVLDGRVIGLRFLLMEDPPHMRKEEAGVSRGVDIQGGVRVSVMMAVDGGPPEHPTLSTGLAHESQNELECPARLIGPVREVPMEPRSQCPHPYEVYDTHMITEVVVNPVQMTPNARR